MRDVGDHSTHFSEGKTEAQGAVRDMPSIPLFQCWPSPAFSPTGHFGLREVVKAAHPYQAVTVDTAWDLCAEDPLPTGCLRPPQSSLTLGAYTPGHPLDDVPLPRLLTFSGVGRAGRGRRLSHFQVSLQSADSQVQTLPPGGSPIWVRITNGPSSTQKKRWALLMEITAPPPCPCSL